MSSLEIANLMYISGDVKTPKLESAQLMLHILRDQMNILLLKAEENVSMQRGRIISHGDVLFIVRNNKIKLKRLLEHLKAMDLKSGSCINRDHLYTIESNPKQRYWKMCIDFLATIEDCGEFSSVLQDETIMDISSKKRQMRQHWRINMMTPSEKEEYLKISKEIFRPVPQFKEWLLKDEVTDLDLTDCALSIMEFLARETIAEIVDMVLLMKMKKLKKGQYLLHDYCAHLVQVESKWKVEIRMVDIRDTPKEATDESQSGGINTILNESSNETQSDSVPVYIDESSKEVPSNHSQSTRHATDVLSDVSDDYNRSAPDEEAASSQHRDTEIFDMSDDDLLDSLQDNCRPGNLSFDSQGPKLNYELSDISDPSDLENNECETDNCAKKPPRRRSRSSCHSEVYTCHFPEELYTFDTSTATNHLSISAKNEVEFLSPIEPSEIADAFVRFQEPSPLEKIFFSCRPIRRRTKLICLADSLSVDNL